MLYHSKYGFTVLVNLSDWIGARLYYIDDYENEEQAYLFQFLKKGQTILDIGANAGLYSLLGSTAVSDKGMVYAFEPMPPNQIKLQKNIQLNQFNNILCQPFAVSNQHTNVNMEFVSENSGMAFINNTGSTMVEAVTIDNWIKSTDIKAIDFIKIDIGANIKVVSAIIND
jgi:FkbM family methyltransferase